MDGTQPLRVGLLLDSFVQPAWISALIEDVRSSGLADVVGVILNGTPSRPHRPLIRRIFTRRPDLLYRAYSWLDERRFRSEPDPFKPTDVEHLLAGLPRLTVTPRETKYCDYFPEEDVAAIRDLSLDVALRFGFRILKGDALRIARSGVWSYHHGDNRVNRGGPAGFWEVVEGHPVTGVILQELNDELDNGQTIYRSYSATNRFSVWKNKRSLYWKSGTFVTRALRDLRDNTAEVARFRQEPSYHPYSTRLYKQPSNREMLRFLPDLVFRHVREKALTIGRREQWFIAYKLRRPGTGTRDVPDGTLFNFKALKPPKDKFWADPFPVLRDGRYYIFFEEFSYAKDKGYISVLPLDEAGRPGAAAIALETEHHLSYPNVFEWNGDLFMLPEAADTGRVQLYRCLEFPLKWAPADVLLENFAGADPTLAKIGQLWWLFVTSSPPNAGCWDDELYLFYADSPLGPWKPHHRNPVKSDVRSARPAGRLFCTGGRLLRPAQDCSLRYGHSIAIQEIVRIDPTNFEEVPSSVILPRWREGLLATHTLNAVGDLTVIDGLWHRGRIGLDRTDAR